MHLGAHMNPAASKVQWLLYGALGVNKRTAQGETVVNRLIVLFTVQIKGVFVFEWCVWYGAERR